MLSTNQIAVIFLCILLVYVVGLHAVQFVNNWMKKIPRAAKLDEGRRPNPILLSPGHRNLVIQLFTNWTSM